LAEDELASAASWYESRQPGLGIALLDLCDKAIARLATGQIPTSAVPGVARDARRILLRRFPYSIVLYENKHELLIIAFAHNSRKPGYWQSREGPG
jgi:hypothetical protein